MDELLADAETHDGQDPTEFRQQYALTAFVTFALSVIGLGVDCLTLTNTHVHSGNLFVALGLAALVYVAGEYVIRQHREGVPLAPTGFTVRGRGTFVVCLALLVAAAAL